ncbi:MAG: endonuclease III [Kiritimatiellia bacterium]
MNPSSLPSVHRILKKEYDQRHAPVTKLASRSKGDPFRVLVATILSSRTKDETTSAACERLFRVVKTPRELSRLSEARLRTLIYPVGFYRTKAKHLRSMDRILRKRFNGKIPARIDDLCSLPGVGRKTANLVMTAAFGKPAVCVDVHVHRICNRLGLLKTRTPLETENVLREILPVRYWKTWNACLVSYGQTICTPGIPKCSECRLYRYCSRVGVGKDSRTRQ